MTALTMNPLLHYLSMERTKLIMFNAMLRAHMTRHSDSSSVHEIYGLLRPMILATLGVANIHDHNPPAALVPFLSGNDFEFVKYVVSINKHYMLAIDYHRLANMLNIYVAEYGGAYFDITAYDESCLKGYPIMDHQHPEQHPESPTWGDIMDEEESRDEAPAVLTTAAPIDDTDPADDSVNEEIAVITENVTNIDNTSESPIESPNTGHSNMSTDHDCLSRTINKIQATKRINENLLQDIKTIDHRTLPNPAPIIDEGLKTMLESKIRSTKHCIYVQRKKSGSPQSGH